jgi:hypothetical protein
MPCGVEHHPHLLLWLVRRQLGTGLDRMRHGLPQVVDLDVEVHGHLGLPFHGRPHRPRALRPLWKARV